MATEPMSPSARTAAFRANVARALAARGFKALAKDLTLRRVPSKGVVESVRFSASHRNGPRSAVCWVALTVTDTVIAKACPGWQAGGDLATDAFGEEASFDLAEEGRGEALRSLVVERAAFFDLVRDPGAVLEAAVRGPIPGLLAPRTLGPYLQVRLGPDAVARYAEGLLAGRPELWPAFVGTVHGLLAPGPAHRLDDGAALAVEALSRAPEGFARDLASRAPAGVAPCAAHEAAHRRHHLGLQLRAWGEAEHTPRLARLDDVAVESISQRMHDRRLPVDHPALIALLLAGLPGAPPTPRRDQPTPRYFQYIARAAPWGRPAFEPA